MAGGVCDRLIVAASGSESTKSSGWKGEGTAPEMHNHSTISLKCFLVKCYFQENAFSFCFGHYCSFVFLVLFG
jgi:hypothetical protein